jgi:acetyltransferase-like isoleucine patch superfamily enzyme
MVDGEYEPAAHRHRRLTMASLYHYLATSDHSSARAVRGLRRRIQNVTVPAPRLAVVPMLWAFLALRSIYFFGKRVLICEPLFKAYCRRHGRGVRTGVYIHWVQGKGDLIVGDDVTVDGKCSFSFAARFSPRPTLIIGDRTGIGHNCQFTVGKQITIGRDCRIAGGTWMFDSSGHPADPEDRRAGLPPSPEEVRPIILEDNVWIGSRSTVYPGVKIGEGSIVSANSVVRSNVRPYTVVAGNPARKIADLSRPARSEPPADGSPPEGGVDARVPTTNRLHPVTTGENR